MKTGGKDKAPSSPFKDVEPWPDPVDGAELLNELSATIRRFVILDLEQATATALWLVFTWLINHATIAPILNITSPEKRCGKSTLLSLVSFLARRAMVASNITPAALFRSVQLWCPTLLIDEADTFLAPNDELRGVLNAGHTFSTAYVIRTVGDSHEPRQFSTWCPKLIAGIGKIPDTIRDRCIIIELHRKLHGERVERLRHTEPKIFDDLAAKLARWSADNHEAFFASRPDTDLPINDRAADNWEPLLAIADLAGGNWPQDARTAALKLSGIEQETPSIGVELLADIREIFETKKVDRLKSVDLLDALCEDDEKRWATWNKGKPINARQLSKRLGEFGIAPQQIRFGLQTTKGYELKQFVDAFERYLTPPESGSETRKQPRKVKELDSNQTETNKPHVSSEVDANELKINECFRVSNATNSHRGPPNGATDEWVEFEI